MHGLNDLSSVSRLPHHLLTGTQNNVYPFFIVRLCAGLVFIFFARSVGRRKIITHLVIHCTIFKFVKTRFITHTTGNYSSLFSAPETEMP